MFLVGLTGSIGCGKSTVSARLGQLGCPVIDADLIARQVVEPGETAWKGLYAHFGPYIFFQDGTLNRKALGQVVFTDIKERKQLNSIIHPEIRKIIIKRVLHYLIRGHQFVVLDVPLLFQSKFYLPYLSRIIVVTCDKDVALSRVVQRDACTVAEAQAKWNAQSVSSTDMEKATDLLDNSGNADALEAEILKVYQDLRNSKSQWKLRGYIASALAALIAIFYTLT